MIETSGLIPAIEACDVMLKTADVSLIGKRKSTASLVSILIQGDVAAVKASVEAGVAAAENIKRGSVIASHVIPRPIGNIERVFGPDNGLNFPKKKSVDTEESGSGNESGEEQKLEVEEAVVEIDDKATENSAEEDQADEIKAEELLEVDDLDKETLDKMMQEFDMPTVMMSVRKLSVPKLRRLARQYDDLGIVGRQVSRANKKNLLKHFEAYYSRQQ